jgi:hypothetical protein
MERNQRIQKERKRLMPHPIYTMPILMHWNLSLTFFPFVPIPVLGASKTTNLLKENSGNKKLRLENHKSFLKNLWEQEISIDEPGSIDVHHQHYDLLTYQMLGRFCR